MSEHIRLILLQKISRYITQVLAMKFLLKIGLVILPVLSIIRPLLMLVLEQVLETGQAEMAIRILLTISAMFITAYKKELVLVQTINVVSEVVDYLAYKNAKLIFKIILSKRNYSKSSRKNNQLLPKWIIQTFDEEQQADLIVLRMEWRQNKPDSIWNNLTVWMKTQHHVVIEVWGNDVKDKLNPFKSRIPRL